MSTVVEPHSATPARRRFLTSRLLPALFTGPRLDVLNPVNSVLPLDPDASARSTLPWRLSLRGLAMATATSEGTVTRCAISMVDGTESHIRLICADPLLTGDRICRLTYRLRADAPRLIRVCAGSDGDPCRLRRMVRLTTDWQIFEDEIIAGDVALPDASLQFWLGQSPGTVWFSDVCLTRPPLCLPPRTSSLELRVFGAAQAVMKSEVASVQIDVVAAARVPWHVQVAIPEVSLEEGKVYTLCYRARADRSRSMRVYAQASGSGDYHSIGLDISSQLTGQWQIFQYTFAAINLEPRPNEIQFQIGDAAGTVWLRDVVVIQGWVTDPPGAEPAPDLVP